MRYIRYFCIAVFALALIAIALANREMVTLQLLPREIAGFFAVAPQISLPLFVVIFGGIAAGLAIGILGEWVREHGIRSDAAKSAREVRRLEREITRLKGEKHKGKDEVLALLDEAS
ncbi:MAG: LapA family protein [Pseudomonadota bacterium]